MGHDDRSIERAPLPLGIREIGPHGIIRSDGALVAALEVQPLNLDVLVESQVAAAVAGLAQLLASLPCPIQIVLRNRAFDPLDYLGDVTRRWSSGWDHKLNRRRRLLGVPECDVAAEGGRPSTYAQAVRAAHGKWQLRQVRCFLLVAPTPPADLRSWWSSRLQRDRHPVDPGVLDRRLQPIRDGLLRAGLQSRRLHSFELIDLVEGLFFPEPAASQLLRHAVNTAQSSFATQFRTDESPLTRIGFDLADPFPEWIDLHPDQVVIQGPGPDARRLRVLALRRYPREVGAGWLRWFAALKHDLDLSLFVAPVDDREARRRLSGSERELLSEVAHSEDVNPEAARASRQRLEDLEDVHEAFRARERYVRTSVVIGVAADSGEGARAGDAGRRGGTGGPRHAGLACRWVPAGWPPQLAATGQ